jgi:hypothetical protein
MTVCLRGLPSTVEGSAAATERLKNQLARKLSPQADVSDEGDLVIAFRISLYDTGSTGLRVGSGVASLVGSPFYGVGDGAVGVDVRFQDANGNELGRIVVDGPIAGAFGSADNGLNAAADSIAKFAGAHFLRPRASVQTETAVAAGP